MRKLKRYDEMKFEIAAISTMRSIRFLVTPSKTSSPTPALQW